MICDADKEKAVVIVNTDDYNDVLEAMVSNSDYVREKRKTIIKIYDRKIKQTLQKVDLKDVDKRSLRQTSPRAACAYLLFKIHKIKAGMKGLPPARLVVSQIGDPSERVSKNRGSIVVRKSVKRIGPNP